MSLYKLENISREYGDGDGLVTALKNISITIAKGKSYVILGASGSGKSTLLNILGGIDKPTEGSIFFEGTNITSLSSRRQTIFREENIGFIFQQYNLLNNLTALENIEFACEIHGISRNCAKDALARVGLESRGSHYPAELSGGEQQRISIARAVVKKPKVLLCDEPTGALDLSTGVSILETLMEINAADDSTVMIVTHNKDVARIADAVLRMRDGEIVENRTNDTIVLPRDIDW